MLIKHNETISTRSVFTISHLRTIIISSEVCEQSLRCGRPGERAVGISSAYDGCVLPVSLADLSLKKS